MRLVNIGFGNMVSAERVVAVGSNESGPLKRMGQEARERGAVIDATFGRKTKTVIVMDSGSIVLSAIMPETITNRFNGKEDGIVEGDKDE